MFQWFFHIFLHDELQKKLDDVTVYSPGKYCSESVVKILEKQNIDYFKAFQRSNERFNRAQKGEKF
jgi:hypothetical protein